MNRKPRSSHTAKTAGSLKSGITIHDAKVKFSASNSRFMWLIPAMLAALMLSGAMLVYFNSLAIQPSLLYFFIIGGCCFLMAWLCMEQRRFVRRLSAITSISLLLILYLALNSRMFASETNMLIRSFASLILRVFEVESPLAERRETLMQCFNSMPIYITLASLVLSYTLIYLRNPIYTLAIALPFCVLAYFDSSLSLIGTMLLVASAIAHCVIITTDQYTLDIFASKKKLFLRFMRNKSILSAAAIMLATIVSTTIISSIFVNPRNYTLGSYVDAARENIGDFFDNLSKIKFLDGKGGNSDAFSEGNLPSIGNRVFSFDEQLYIETDIRDAIYIKCYTGSIYNGNKWTDLPNSYYEQLFSTNGFNTNSIVTLWRENHNYLSRLGMMSSNYLNVTDLMDNKQYGFMPYCIYGAASSQGMGISVLLDRDARASNDGTYAYALYNFEDNYTYSYYEWLLRNYNSADAETIAIYSDFVRERYTAVPAASQRIMDEFGDYSALGIDEKLTLVRKYLDDNTTYTLSPGKVPNGRDFATYFLYESKSGYCVHYATAAAIMLRAMGVPTRFAEGYLYYGKDGEARSGVLLTDENRHAWVEVYYDELGWLPVEFTVAFAGNIGTTPRPTATIKPTPAAFNTPAPTVTSTPMVGASASPGTPNPSGDAVQPPPLQTAEPGDGSKNAPRTLYSILFQYRDGQNAPALIVLLRVLPIILMLVVGVLALRLYIVINKRRRRFSCDSPTAAMDMYGYILWLLSSCGVACNNSTTPLELAKQLESSEFCELADSLLEVSNCVYAQRFADTKPSIAEICRLNSFVGLCENRYYSLQGGLGKLSCLLLHGIFPPHKK